MRWETVKSTPEQEVYHLYKDDKKRLTLVLNPFSNSARIECDKEKRVFLLRKEGFRRNKTVIRNEYGIKIAEFGHENVFDHLPAEHIELDLLRRLTPDDGDLAHRVMHLRYRVRP